MSTTESKFNVAQTAIAIFLSVVGVFTAGFFLRERIFSTLDKRYIKSVSSEPFANIPVGTILPSFLPPNRFSEVANGKPYANIDYATTPWVLADGRPENADLPASCLYRQKTDQRKLPDLRGMFIRGMNEGRNDGIQDPDTRIVGSYQPDSFATHGHTYADSQFNPTRRKVKGSGGTQVYNVGTYTHPVETTGQNGGAETRPKNIAVYYYIKIN